MKHACIADWTPLDISGHCRVWTQDKDGVQRRMTNRAKVVQLLANQLDHLEGRTPRILFCQAFAVPTAGAEPKCNASPLISVRWIDNIVNERLRTYHVLALPRNNASYDSNEAAVIGTNAAGSSNAAFYAMSGGAPVFPRDVECKQFRTERGASSNATYTEALHAVNAVPLIDIVCQSDQINTFDTDLGHDFVWPYSATPGGEIVTGLTESIREKFHRLRLNHNRLAVCFLGLAPEAGYGTIGTTGVDGFRVVGASYYNILDDTSTVRDASTPGVMVPGYFGGIGSAASHGVHLLVFASSSLGAPTYVKFIGPDHVANNNVVIAVTSATPTWYESGPVLLNSNAADTDATTARNKIDIHAVAAEGVLSIYTILGYTLQV